SPAADARPIQADEVGTMAYGAASGCVSHKAGPHKNACPLLPQFDAELERPRRHVSSSWSSLSHHLPSIFSPPRLPSPAAEGAAAGEKCGTSGRNQQSSGRLSSADF